MDTYCLCLLPNHFHLLVRIKAVSDIQANLQSASFNELSLTEKKFLDCKATTSELIEHSLRRFFQSYSLSFNKMYDRKGNLFSKPFKRVEVNKDSHFTQAIVYIHANPVKHKLTEDFTKYAWSSWHIILSNAPTQLLRNEVLDWFGGKESFFKIHREIVKFYYESEISIED